MIPEETIKYWCSLWYENDERFEEIWMHVDSLETALDIFEEERAAPSSEYPLAYLELYEANPDTPTGENGPAWGLIRPSSMLGHAILRRYETWERVPR